MIVPAFFAFLYNVFLFRQSFKSIPKELDEAAIMDGCTHAGVFFRMLVPLSKPTFVTIGILSSVYYWRDRQFWYMDVVEKALYNTVISGIARTLASLGEYIYFQDDYGIWVNLYVSGLMKIRHLN